MHFTSLIAAAILAGSSFAAPALEGRTATPPASSSAAPPAPVPTLSKTAQLFLADTAADRYSLLPENKDFVFDFGASPTRGKGGKGGDLVAANRKTFPALVGTGSGMAVGFLGACGFNTPHVHPRATELQVVTAGTLIVEMAPENGVFNVPGNATSGRRIIRNQLTVGQMTPFYLGSVHTQYNPECSNATFVASFNSEDFGTGSVVDEVASFSREVAAAAFGEAIDGSEIDAFKKVIPVSIAQGVEQCLQKCGIQKRK
jgi:hypothetical protein